MKHPKHYDTDVTISNRMSKIISPNKIAQAFKDEHIPIPSDYGETECCQEGIGKVQRREACDPKDVPGGVTIKNWKGALQCRAFFLWRNIDENGIVETEN